MIPSDFDGDNPEPPPSTAHRVTVWCLIGLALGLFAWLTWGAILSDEAWRTQRPPCGLAMGVK